ncbi:endonuclease III, partial [bacterium]|nr:endonuclease III [bacterium]
KNVDAVEQALMKRVPKPYLLHAHHWLILHGRYTCKARNPNCAQCPVFALCLDPERHARRESFAV